MLRIGRVLEKTLEILHPPRAAHSPCVYLLEAEDICFESVELRAEHGGAVLEGSPSTMRVAEAFQIEGANAHLRGAKEWIAL
jgi:hypothetical protein